MALPLLEYKPQHKTNGFAALERRTRTKIPLYLSSGGCVFSREMRSMIWAAYRQVFSEHETLKFNRQITLETRLANGSITVRDFMRVEAKSERFYEMVVSVNNNYRLVDICLRRLLGRSAYNKDEEIAWSIKTATLGFHGLLMP